jgi:hypothetical protein
MSSDGGIDYETTSGTLTFNAGVTLQTFTVPVCADNQGFFNPPEGDETFLVTLSGPTGGAALADPQGQGTIVDDDITFVSTIVHDDISISRG